MSKWFTANKLSLNVDKTNIITCIANKYPIINGYGKYIEESKHKIPLFTNL